MVCSIHQGSERKLVSKSDQEGFTIVSRPVGTMINLACHSCGKEIIRELEWWRCMNDGCEGKYWIKDDPEHLDVNDYYCSECLDTRLKRQQKARELQTDCPPAWFDPDFCGERWNDDY